MADDVLSTHELLKKERARNRSLLSDLRVRDDTIAKLEAQARERDLEGRAALKPIVVERTAHASGAPGYPVTIWSDWHWGETVDVRQMGGKNAFDEEIACARVRSLVNGTIGLLRDYAGKNPEYPGIWVCLGGDMISGDIHEELIETNWSTVAGQAIEVSRVLAGALTAMADEFGKVDVPCVVGNHGRTTLKPRAKHVVRDSYEFAVYSDLQKHFANDPRVTIYVPETPEFLFTVYGHRFMLTHGDRLGVKGGDGIIGAIGPITRGSVKAKSRMSHIDQNFDTMIIGHYHMYTPRGDGNTTIVNGTLKGYDEYARNMLGVPFSEPVQALWLVSPKHGIAAQWRVDCGNLTGVDQ